MPWHYVPEVDAFTIYHQVQEERAPEQDFSFLDSLGHAVAGAVGTAVSNVAVYPLDTVTTRLQVQDKKGKGRSRSQRDLEKGQPDSDDDGEQYTSLADAFRKIYAREGGMPAFYGGVLQGTLKSMTDSFLFFLAYNALCNARQHSATKDRNIYSRLIDEVGIGMVAGAFTKGVTFPLQQVVTRKQSGDPAMARASVAHILGSIYKEQGVAGFWSGYSATLILTLNPSIAMSVHSFLERATVGEGKTGPLLTFLFAASSKAIASCTMYPVSLAKTRAQAGAGSGAGKQQSGPLSVLKAIHDVAQHDGIAALYQGVWAEVLKGFFNHGLTMLVKDRVHGLVIKIYFWLLRQLKNLRK